ncbi:ATP synthase-associated protein, putative [Hepatocystis sp. ex Piliocolobus tephrosceles]|nr:ATP synthase-associated protein, putative [Hepatocystis sp. ex Piliocolobus tephrosceles]
MNRYIWNSIFRDINYRTKKLYHSFYYSQSHIKYVMLILFPSIIWSTRYRADTKLGYFFYISDEKLYPKNENITINDIDKSSLLTNSLSYLKNLLSNRKWKNGMKLYLNDDLTVNDVKKIIYKKEEYIPKNIKLGCKGRMMDSNDNLALAVRAFCKRDPKIFIWEDTSSNFA